MGSTTPVAHGTCSICKQTFPKTDLHSARTLRPRVADYIAKEHAATWTPEGQLCPKCLNESLSSYVMQEMAEDRGELSEIEQEIARTASQHLIIAQDMEEAFDRGGTPGQRAADAVARVGGSWGFVIAFGIVLAIWMSVNVLLLNNQGYDPYPFILLNLVLSTLAAIQAPIIMMSQNRVSERDRLQAREDFRTNLKAEIEIASLHEKIDHLLHAQWERMVSLQELEINLLREVQEQLGIAKEAGDNAPDDVAPEAIPPGSPSPPPG